MSAQNELDKCALIENEEMRHERLITHLKKIDSPEWGRSIKTLIDITSSLRGLSPRSLDCLRVLPQCSEALCGMLLSAPADVRDKIIGLENKLPFLWMSLPFETWKMVQNIRYKDTLQTLMSVPGMEDAHRVALAGTKKVFSEIGDSTTWFKGIYQLEKIDSLQDLSNLVGPHIDMWDDTFRVQLDDELNQKHILSESKTFSKLPYKRTPSLLAPLALAAASHQRINLSIEQMNLIRNALAIDPDYVKIGFVHAMRESRLWEKT